MTDKERYEQIKDAVTRALRTHGGMAGRRLAERIEEICRAVH